MATSKDFSDTSASRYSLALYELAEESKIVDEIESGKLQDARDSIQDGIKEKAAQAVDMKRVEAQVDWVNNKENESETTEEE